MSGKQTEKAGRSKAKEAMPYERKGNFTLSAKMHPTLDPIIAMRKKSQKNTPGAIRTRDPLLRRQLLYPAELQTHNFSFVLNYQTRALYLFNHVNLKYQVKILEIKYNLVPGAISPAALDYCFWIPDYIIIRGSFLFK